jgi:Holliday junction resolvasome RuvABC endonuclease subunit
VAAYPKQVKDPQTGKLKTIHTVNADQLLLPALAAAACAACDVADVPWGLISPKTWRAAYYGKGFKPSDWKIPAVDAALQMGVPLPLERKAQRDAAEAVGIAYCWMKCTQIRQRHYGAFKDLCLGHRKAA